MEFSSGTRKIASLKGCDAVREAFEEASLPAVIFDIEDHGSPDGIERDVPGVCLHVLIELREEESFHDIEEFRGAAFIEVESSPPGDMAFRGAHALSRGIIVGVDPIAFLSGEARQ